MLSTIDHVTKKTRPIRVTQAEKRSCQKRKLEDENAVTQRPTTRTKLDGSEERSANADQSQYSCYFCGKNDEKLHEVTSFRLDRRVRRCSYILIHTEQALIGKLSRGDMIAQEAKYHASCLTDLYRRADRVQLGSICSDDEKEKHGLAFAAVVSFIEDQVECFDSEKNEGIFKLSDLVKIYSKRLAELQADHSTRTHSTRLKERILSQFEDMRAFNQGREVFLAYETAVGEALKTASNISYDDEAFVLVQAARIVRRKMKDRVPDRFIGTFEDQSQERSVSGPLHELVSMILNGCSTGDTNPMKLQAALSISQLIEFHATFRQSSQRQRSTISSYHKKQREPPLPIYIGTLIHTRTRSKKLIEKLFDVGLSISYHRLLEISTQLGNAAIEEFEAENVVCPPRLDFGLFTSAAIDNLDINPSSNTATSSFHGTALSLFQHGEPSYSGAKRHRNPMETSSDEKYLRTLPNEYTDIKPTVLIKNIDITHPEYIDALQIEKTAIPYVDEETYFSEFRWMDYVQSRIENNHLDGLDFSWAAFHATKLVRSSNSPDRTALFPLFRENSKSPAMIKHALDVIWRAVQFLNEGQSVVVALDQPLYAIAKKIQWQWPEQYGIHKFVLMLGGLHTEMAYLSALGDWLDESGWVQCLSNSSVATTGVAESFLTGGKVAKSRYVHQVTVCSLDILMKRACRQENTEDDFVTWKKKIEDQFVQFKFWSTTMDMELLLLRFVRSLRIGDFNLYIKSIDEMLPLFFALDHGHYSRWLPIHLYDMKSLHLTNPQVYDAFKEGKFVVSKTARKFSSIPLDHAHEQNNKSIKGNGGAVGLTEAAAELRRWMVSGPEVTRVVHEFEKTLPFNEKLKIETNHHEQNKSFQDRFCKHVSELTAEIEALDNPFIGFSEELVNLDSKDVAEKLVCESVYKIKAVGAEKFTEYQQERLVKHSKPIYDTIPRNKLPLFTYRPQLRSKSTSEVATLRNNVKLFSELYIANQRRNGDIDLFFTHENAAVPPSLSKDGKLRPGNKSDLLPCIESHAEISHESPAVDGYVIEGSVMVNVLRPSGQKNFSEYVRDHLISHLRTQLQKVQRLDVVWDVYIDNSLKMTTRQYRGDGARRKVRDNTQLPHKWETFLRVDENKTELYHYIATSIQTYMFPAANSKQIVTSYDDQVLTSGCMNLDHLSPCNHEEADYRAILHSYNMSKCGISKVMIFTADTDVVAIAVSLFSSMMLKELWIKFGAGKHIRYLPIHEIVASMGPEKSQCLSLFHSLTGCDQVSYFASCGKKTAWKTWTNYPDLTSALLNLRYSPSIEMVDANMGTIERFICLMYQSTTTKTEVNKCRRELFTKHGRQLEGLPPTSSALRQHTLRAVYQGGYVWAQALVPIQILPDPENWGWIRNNNIYLPKWSALRSVVEACRELTKCACKIEKGCKRRCSCRRVGLPCTELCQCNGDCERGSINNTNVQ